MKYAMLGFAGIAFLVGIFLIVNTFSMLVAQRTREIGLMRAIGSSRKQVNRSVLVEALLLGVVGSVLGVGAGVGLAVGLMKLMGDGRHEPVHRRPDHRLDDPGDRPGARRRRHRPRRLPPGPPRRARSPRWPPCATPAPPPTRKAGCVRAVIGLVLTGAGGAAPVRAPPGADKASDGSLLLGLGVVLTLIGFVVIGPLLAGVVVRVLGARACCGSSARSAGWPSATRCATRAVRAPPAPP